MPQDYSMTDIARLIEANNAHVLSLLSYTDKTTGRLHLIIKIDLEDVSPVIRSFERFNYTVLYYLWKGDGGRLVATTDGRIGLLYEYISN